jgi:hypothetical protein
MESLTISFQSCREVFPFTIAVTTTVAPRKAKIYSGRAGRPMRMVMEGQSSTVMSMHCHEREGGGRAVRVGRGGGRGGYQESVEPTDNESDEDGGEVPSVGDVHRDEDAGQLSGGRRGERVRRRCGGGRRR